MAVSRSTSGGKRFELPADLSPQQLTAVVYGDGPLMIDAGAGSGKTRTIVCRIGHLLAVRKIPSHQVLGVTFTTPAAAELGARVRNLTGAVVRCGTFHSWAREILRKHAKDDSKVYDDLQVRRLMAALLKSLLAGGAPAESERLSRLTNADDIKSAISWAKNTGQGGPESFVPPPGMNDEVADLTREVWSRYEETKRRDGGMDFDDMLINAVALLRTDARARHACHMQWRHILVDEFQDVNALQFDMVRMVVEDAPVDQGQPCQLADWKGRSFTICGDGDQSIYAFRGADVRLILRFPLYYPTAAVVSLATNYRSTKTIVRAAATVVGNNSARTQKQLAAAGEEGERISLHPTHGDEDEISFVAGRIRSILAERESLGLKDHEPSVAILFRRNSKMREIRRALRGRGVCARMTGGIAVDRQPEIKLAAAILRAAAQPSDNRVMSQAARIAFRDGLARQFVTRAQRSGLTLWEAIAREESEEALLLRTVMAGVIDAARYCSPLAALGVIDRHTHYIARLARGQTAEAEDQLDSVTDLLKSIPQTATLTEIAELLERPNGSTSPAVVELLTVHGAKGLEWDNVFLVDLREGIFPDGDTDIEEERRLFYVAITRARKRVFITCPRDQYSRFIPELPGDAVMITGRP